MKYIGGFFLVLLLLLTACGKGEIEQTMSSKIADFEFTTQDNDTLGLDDLKGEWWVADFIFTNCTTVCLPMTTNMNKLQDELADHKLDAQLVSFSVDPETDTPEVLRNYAEGYGASFDNWTFLTGYDFETIQKLSIESFKSGLADDPDSDQVTHGAWFFLVNPDGEAIKAYSGIDADAIQDIIEDLKKVL